MSSRVLGDRDALSTKIEIGTVKTPIAGANEWDRETVIALHTAVHFRRLKKG